MKKNFTILVVILLSISSINSQELFQENSKDWHTVGNANWEFIDNELVGSLKSGAGFVVTDNTFKNFNLELEFMPDKNINSGVFVRCKNDSLSAVNCYEFNIWDTNPNPDNRTGAVVNKFPPLRYVETIDKWNTYKVTVNEDHLQVWVNDVLTIDTHDEFHIEGYIGLQARGEGEIKFRNVKISKLK